MVHKYWQFVNGLHKENCDINDRDLHKKHDNQEYNSGLSHIPCYK